MYKLQINIILDRLTHQKFKVNKIAKNIKDSQKQPEEEDDRDAKTDEEVKQ